MMKHCFTSAVIICALFNMVNAQDTLSPLKWWLNLSSVGMGYFLDGSRVFNMGINYNHVISRHHNIYIEMDGDMSIARLGFLGGAAHQLLSANLLIGKIIMRRKHSFLSSSIGLGFMQYIYPDPTDTRDLYDISVTPKGISASILYVCWTSPYAYRDKKPVFRGGIGIELSTNINKYMSVVAVRITVPIIKDRFAVH